MFFTNINEADKTLERMVGVGAEERNGNKGEYYNAADPPTIKRVIR